MGVRSSICECPQCWKKHGYYVASYKKLIKFICDYENLPSNCCKINKHTHSNISHLSYN